MMNQGVARKACLIITFAITVPLCLAFYYLSEQQKHVILMEDERELTRISLTLAQRISQNGKPMYYWSEYFVTEGQTEKKTAELTAYYQPKVEELAAMYPNYRMGIYHQKIDNHIAVYPSSSQEWFIFKDHPEVRKLYKTGEAATVVLQNPNGDKTPFLVSFTPIFHLGEVVGFTWAGKKIDNVLSESHAALIQGLIILICVWLIMMLVVRAVFYKLDKSLVRFASKVNQDPLLPVEFHDFPQLEPLFDTVVKLREDLKMETEHYLEESRTLKDLIELAPLAIFLVDKNGILKAYNQAFLSYHPYFQDESAVNVPYKFFTDNTNRNYEETVVIRALKGARIHNEYAAFLNRYWLSNALPLKNKEEQITGAIAICHDITEHEKLRKEMVRLDRLNIVGQMAASVAHEVRNPMTVARGYIQSLSKKTGDTYRAQFSTIIEELDRANHIISDFLSLARDKYVERKKESLCKIIQDIMPMVESEALVRNVECDSRLDEQVPLLLLNSEEIKQLVLNLTMNALDAMEGIKQGKLTIACAYNEAKGRVELKVTDTGCGMERSAQEKVFEPFYTTKKNGSGLGLSVCKSIVDRHGGFISVESEKNKGSVFVVSFPLEV